MASGACDHGGSGVDWRRLFVGCAVAVLVPAGGASAAAAATFYVNERGGSATCSGPGINACPTIKEAVLRAEKAAPPNTIEVEPETGGTIYHETIELTHPTDAGITINGEEPGVVILGKKDPAAITHVTGAVTLSNLKLKASNELAFLKAAVVDAGATLTLDNVAVENESGEGEDGIDAREGGSLTMNGGQIEMEGGAKGWAVFARFTPLVLNGVKILNGAGVENEAGGIDSEKSSLSMTNTQVSIEAGEASAGIAAGSDSAVSIQNVAVRQNSAAIGVVLEASPATVSGLRVEMVRASSTTPAVLSEDEGASSTFSGLEVVGGTWKGVGLLAIGGDLELTDSRVIESASSESAAVKYFGPGSSAGLLVQRSVLQAAPKAKSGALVTENANATVDSSEILGGRNAAYVESTSGSTFTLTLSASTLDAGAAGIASDAAGTNGVEAVAKGAPASVANVAIQGSIVLETQAASAAAGDQASIGCSYSAAPNQTQAASGGAGAIACASGANANTEVNPLSSLFPEPLAGYQLSASSSALDSVPVAAVALPFGLTRSATDLAGNPRAESVACALVQDKGALQLPGHSSTCPTAIPIAGKGAGPVVGVLTGLTISPAAFFAAPKGPTIAKRRRYGAKISYRDSQAATTTFTVLRQSSGRRQGRSCRKPSRRNRHGRRCTLLTKVGSFTHADRAGADSVRFSGRINGRKLASGAYTLQAVPRDAAGIGAAVRKSFRIK
jgi:hypothetical protein